MQTTTRILDEELNYTNGDAPIHCTSKGRRSESPSRMTRSNRVLIAEDDEDLSHALKQRCQSIGLVVDVALDGATAVDKFGSFAPDLAIFDVNMPRGDGLDALEMVSRDPNFAAIPYIVVTGRKDIETRKRCQMVNAHYVAKCPNVWLRLKPLILKYLSTAKVAMPDQSKVDARVHRLLCADSEHTAPPDLHRRAAKVAPSLEQQTNPTPPKDPPSAVDLSQERFVDALFSSIGSRVVNGEASDSPESSPNPNAKPTVLCIDDDADLLNSLTLRLEQYGIEVLQANRGMEGYIDAFLSDIKVIILDYEMPGENGTYTLKRLKENPMTRSILVIVLTGRKDAIIERAVYSLGAARFLNKPVEWDKLIGELRKHVPAIAVPISL